MRIFDIIKKLRAKQSASYVNHIEISHGEVNSIVDKLEEQEQAINTAKRLLRKARYDGDGCTQAFAEELEQWLEDTKDL